MVRGRIASPVDEEEDYDQEDRANGSSRKRQRTTTKSKKASASAAVNGVGNASDSDGDVVSEDEEALAAALRGWTVDSFTNKPVQGTKVVVQQVRLHILSSLHIWLPRHDRMAYHALPLHSSGKCKNCSNLKSPLWKSRSPE